MSKHASWRKPRDQRISGVCIETISSSPAQHVPYVLLSDPCGLEWPHMHELASRGRDTGNTRLSQSLRRASCRWGRPRGVSAWEA